MVLSEKLMEVLESIQNRILSEVGDKMEYIPTHGVWMACPTYCDSNGECSM